MRSTIVLACVCVTLACTATEPDPDSSVSLASDPAPVRENPPIGAWVVIDEGQGLFKTAGADAERIITTPHDEPADRLRIAEVTAIAGDFIEVRTILQGESCASDVGFERDHQLRFFVRPELLHPVLVRPKQFEFDDGTKLELVAGVPVIETGAEGRIRVGKTQLVVDLADEDVGRWFAASTIEPASKPKARQLELDAELHYGQRSFVAEWVPFRVAHEQDSDRKLLTFLHACGRFVLSAELDDAEVDARPFGPERMTRTSFDPDLAAVGGIDSGFWGCRPLAWTAPIGAELSWSDGGEAGVVLAKHELPRSADDRGDRVCFEVSGLYVCIAAPTLERTGDADCESPSVGFSGRDFADFGARARRPLHQVRLAKAEVGAGLDRYAVRRIVRAHINDVRRCYNRGIERHPKLAGRVVIAFEISGTGKVSSSAVKATTLEPVDEEVPGCIAEAVERWTFPEPSTSATVSVVYPFQLSPG
jgi:hypothetical protein